jgi:hypothetical protein
METSEEDIAAALFPHLPMRRIIDGFIVSAGAGLHRKNRFYNRAKAAHTPDASVSIGISHKAPSLATSSPNVGALDTDGLSKFRWATKR